MGQDVQDLSENRQSHHDGGEGRRQRSRKQLQAAPRDPGGEGGKHAEGQCRCRDQAGLGQRRRRHQGDQLRGQRPARGHDLRRVRDGQHEPLHREHQNLLQQDRWRDPPQRGAELPFQAKGGHRVRSEARHGGRRGRTQSDRLRPRRTRSGRWDRLRLRRLHRLR